MDRSVREVDVTPPKETSSAKRRRRCKVVSARWSAVHSHEFRAAFLEIPAEDSHADEKRDENVAANSAPIPRSALLAYRRSVLPLRLERVLRADAEPFFPESSVDMDIDALVMNLLGDEPELRREAEVTKAADSACRANETLFADLLNILSQPSTVGEFQHILQGAAPKSDVGAPLDELFCAVCKRVADHCSCCQPSLHQLYCDNCGSAWPSDRDTECRCCPDCGEGILTNTLNHILDHIYICSACYGIDNQDEIIPCDAACCLHPELYFHERCMVNVEHPAYDRAAGAFLCTDCFRDGRQPFEDSGTSYDTDSEHGCDGEPDHSWASRLDSVLATMNSAGALTWQQKEDLVRRYGPELVQAVMLDCSGLKRLVKELRTFPRTDTYAEQLCDALQRIARRATDVNA
eukprot:TRINITY_DN22577_c0_g2_i1.p1 TRINITY_DN22577_c0_g2~~TRINITY_DN22577_c0_g2_i1.p1  ORF type:complete len:406 (+),score=42.66 TRINITY_DN22577_c0_g2_i1:80-1297(+)